MKYYLVPKKVAEEANLCSFRNHDSQDRYIVTAGDLVTYPLSRALEEGADEITREQALAIINQ